MGPVCPPITLRDWVGHHVFLCLQKNGETERLKEAGVTNEVVLALTVSALVMFMISVKLVF